MYNESTNFGVLDFRAGEKPSVRFSLVNAFGRLAWAPVEVPADDLRNGVPSALKHIDPR